MKKFKKTAIAVILTILLSAAGSALWEILKPLSSNLRNLLINIATLGIIRVKDSLFLSVAKGFHESVSLEVLSFMWGFIVGLPIVTLLMMLFYKYFKKITIRIKDIIKDDDPANRSHQAFKIVIALYIIFFLTISIFEIYKTDYVNRSITYYNQLLNATAPYLTQTQEESINSNFAQIKTEQDYNFIIEQLQEVATREGIIIN